METRCCSLYRLKYKAVKMLIIISSLLFYVIGIHIHYYQRTLSFIGSLENVDSSIQQQVLNHIFRNDNLFKEGIHVLMKNGYYRQGQVFLFVDFFVVFLTIVFIFIVFTILYINKRHSLKKAYELERELDYLKEELEYFLFNGTIDRNDKYDSCNYLLDRLEQRVYDVNELNASELERMMTFHQNIIHQINTPLNIIKISTEQLALQGKVEQEYLDTIQYAVDKAAGLAYTYMRSSKMDAGKAFLEYEEIQLFDLIEDIFDLLKVTAKHFQSILINRCKQSMIYADESWITEAITNIVKNAIENAGEEKVVIVSSEEDKDKVYIYIEDNGDADIIVDEVLFERFESSKTGIGIGLHLCKQIIERHLGEITVERSPMGGLRFIIILPKINQKLKVDLGDEGV